MSLKRALTISLFFVILVFAQTPQQLVETLAALPELDHAQWSVYARYVNEENGEGPVIDHQSEMSLSCASSLKVLTIGLALDKLGGDFTFKTRLFYSGSIDQKGTLHGNIYIVGDGDPTLAGDQVWGAYKQKKLLSEWVKSIKRKGIKVIDGAVVADESLYAPYHVPVTWVWEDLGNYYGAGLTALCFLDNKYYLDFKPGEKEGDPAEVLAIRPHIPGLTYTNKMKTGALYSGDNGYILSAPNVYHAVFHGTVPAGEEKFTIKGAIPNPPLLAAQSLNAALQDAKIPVGAPSYVVSESQLYRNDHLLKTIKSPPLRRIAEITNKLSNNTYTEMLLLKVAQEQSGNGNTEEGIKQIEKFMDKLGIDHEGMRLVDASGLSRENMITTKVFSDYLSAMSQQRSFADFFNTFAIAGDGDDFGYVVYFAKDTPAANNARIKTGYIGGVRSHTGYVSTRSDRLIAFSCIANNYHCKTKAITKLHEQVVVALANME
ncbi:MAG: D-alanyl-D-alanine carboxypeptidase/D-alanyl-D-alanine-endopeptidase [Candidatus Marinimicrobia bacterium]|nr:D-alanyl-D-alanine carboxypeptidase/D-alanyl-D-alanine-endopeptidase [Candidatus Neomarinimicrobiota bacterium]